MDLASIVVHDELKKYIPKQEKINDQILKELEKINNELKEIKQMLKQK